MNRREIRHQLASLFDEALREQGLTLPPRALALKLRGATELLSRGGAGRVGMTWTTITRGSLHRHIYLVRCPDQAFFLDGIKVYLARRGIQPLARQAVVMRVEHDPQGRITAISAAEPRAGGNEMIIALHVSATLVPDGAALYRDLSAIVHAVHASVRDFDDMIDVLRAAGQRLAGSHPEEAAMLGWMRDGKYILFGLSTDGRWLGIMSDLRTLERVAPGLRDDLEALAPATAPGLEWLYLPHAQQFLYGAANLEVVRIAWMGETGLESAVVLGYFSRSARHTNASQTPLLAPVWRRMNQAPLLARSAYLAREVRTLFDRLPKPLLLSVPPDEVLEAMHQIAEMGTPERSEVFVWRPRPGMVRLLVVALSAERFSPEVEQTVLEAAGIHGFDPLHHYSERIGPHALMFISGGTGGGNGGRLKNLRQAVQECAITWKDRARSAIKASMAGPELPAAVEALSRVPNLYMDLFPPETFVSDLRVLEQVRTDGQPHVRLEVSPHGLDMHIFTALPVALGSLVTIVQHFGLSALKEVVVDFSGDPPVHLTTLYCAYRQPVHTDALPRLKEALEEVLTDRADNDPANALVLSAGLTIRQVAVLITLRSHLVQLVADASPGAVTATLNAHPAATASVYRLFAARHDPASSGEEEAALGVFGEMLNEVQNLTDDRRFRQLAELVRAGVRTNAYTAPSGAPLAIKVCPQRLSFAPRPHPYREVFVHGPHVEGVHLRGGPIARGGLRLSDRPTDYRTEVLGLMSTQLVKNSIIVPTGAKGGFVVKGGGGSGFIQDQYRAFIRALLSVTDNLVDGNAVPPPGVRVAPEDAGDPYLVVAADKGTAAFSDLANAEAQAAGFWLGDAFASGGSHGYDHKKYGITARGAWVCVCHHLATLGLDPARDPVTVTGIGDMGGDVFGNGLLQSRAVRLLAAFNHQHVFLDPDPDPAASYRERARLFAAGGGWDQYDPRVISKGGGVFPRTAKRIPVGPEAAKALGIEPGDQSGEDLVRAVLKAPVDLLYNGGIGTYVKAAAESHQEVADPANNAVRVSASELRCRVVGEGGNLGFTPRARIEYARRGGLINTDAIDNSGGVDMSDHEVNLKILLAHARNRPPLSRRNRLLADLGEQVAGLCLATNLAQARTLTLAEAEVRAYPPRAHHLRDRLVAEGLLDPDTHPGMEEGSEATLTLRPQLAVLAGHEKNRLAAALAEASFTGASPFRDDLLDSYFPARIRRAYGEAVRTHPLADNIVHTLAAGRLVDHFGLFAVSHLQDLVGGADPAEAAHALLAAERVLNAPPLREAIWVEIPNPATAVAMQLALQGHLQHFAEEMLRLCHPGRMSRDAIEAQRRHFARYRVRLEREQAEGGAEPAAAFGTPPAGGLPAVHAAWYRAMPLLGRCGVAVEAASRLDLPLGRCLTANQEAFRLLPFLAAESQLRSPAWGEGDHRALRAEWLHRLILMRSRAVVMLLATGARDLHAAGKRLWHGHRDWEGVSSLARELAAESAPSPTRVMLLLTRFESLIDETA